MMSARDTALLNKLRLMLTPWWFSADSSTARTLIQFMTSKPTTFNSPNETLMGQQRSLCLIHKLGLDDH